MLLQVLSADALWARSKPRLRRQRSSLSKVLAVSLMKKRRRAACALADKADQLRVPWETRSLRRSASRRRVWVCGVMVVVVVVVAAGRGGSNPGVRPTVEVVPIQPMSALCLLRRVKPALLIPMSSCAGSCPRAAEPRASEHAAD